MTSLIICPHCGRVVDVSDPKVAMLPYSTLAVWHRLTEVIKPGERIGSTRVAKLAQMTQPAAYWHIRQLLAAGLIEAIPKRRGGKYRVYRIPK